ncbi:MAG: nucleotidyltransferase domain-containing protein [Flavobacteriales bacterium]|nr:nucleotidyltransferase domain-containing protein [Flavobacteriales bacterium]
MHPLIKNNIAEISRLCKEYKVRSLALFGSAAKGGMSKDSVLDFLVEFSEDLDVLDYADNYFDFVRALEKMTGRKIDLLSVSALKNPVLKQEIYNTKIDLYAA